ncbi:hypothetical protein M413DRAFT_369066 [Hebeloma cylindrosporum]|uniref:Uncharacterized protein n=1 Tax=Hebeloma cylindrosporum TaxID=76867 RepID=A0A0C3BEJ0_HEBCY|nr:hypothetical protein M413DRAFT_369066 [Hebeloma cylindrosporum h7]
MRFYLWKEEVPLAHDILFFEPIFPALIAHWNYYFIRQNWRAQLSSIIHFLSTNRKRSHWFGEHQFVDPNHGNPQNRYIIGGLVLIILGHWSIILQGVQVTTILVPGVGCQIMQSHSKILPAILIYSMCFDFIVLSLNTYKLIGIKSSPSRDLMGRGRLTHMIFTDGLIFFIFAFLSNFVATVFLVLNLNQVMGVIFNVPAAVSSTIVACRAVRRLTNFTYNGPEII